MEGRGKELGNTKSLDSDVDGSNSSGFGSVRAEGGNGFLHGNVIGILGEEVRHGSRIFLLQDADVGNVIFVRHGVSEGFLSGGISNSGVGNITSASVGLDTDTVSTLGGDGEFDLVEIGEVVSGRSLQCLARGEFLVGLTLFNGFDTDVVETDQKGQFVDGHVLQHTFSVTLEALSQRFRGVLVGVVGNESDVGSFVGGSECTSLGDVFADVLVVSHKDSDTGSLGFVSHGSEFGNSRSSRLFQVDSGASVGNALSKQTRIVGGTSRNQSQTLFAISDGGELAHALVESDAESSLGLLLEFTEFRASRTSGTYWKNDDDAKKLSSVTIK